MCAPMPSSPKLQLNPQIQSYIANGDLSHADLMWSLFLPGHLNLSGICKELVAKNGDQKPICNNEIGLCAQNIGTTLGVTFNTIGRAYVII